MCEENKKHIGRVREIYSLLNNLHVERRIERTKKISKTNEKKNLEGRKKNNGPGRMNDDKMGKFFLAKFIESIHIG